MNNWADNIEMTVMHCDTRGRVTYMNKKCGEMFKKFGGMELIGKNIFDCHPEGANAKLKEIMDKRVSHSYSIERDGRKTMLHSFPLLNDKGEYIGFGEITYEIPYDMPHYVRDKKL